MSENVNDPSNANVKPGWKSTEWIGLIVAILYAIISSGLLDANDPQHVAIAKVISSILVVAGALGYAGVRGAVKATVARGAADVAVARAKVPGLDRE